MKLTLAGDMLIEEGDQYLCPIQKSPVRATASVGRPVSQFPHLVFTRDIKTATDRLSVRLPVRCAMCKTLMKQEDDCGGDCVWCMAEFGEDPECMAAIKGRARPPMPSPPP